MERKVLSDDTVVSKAFLMVRSISSETFIRSFQFKILNDITFTFCGVESETLYYLFYQCSFRSQI